MDAKFTLKKSFDRDQNFYGIRQIIEDAATPDSYSYSGSLERVQEHSNRVAGILGRLIENLYEKNKLTLEEISEIADLSGDLVKNA